MVVSSGGTGIRIRQVDRDGPENYPGNQHHCRGFTHRHRLLPVGEPLTPLAAA